MDLVVVVGMEEETGEGERLYRLSFPLYVIRTHFVVHCMQLHVCYVNVNISTHPKWSSKLECFLLQRQS